MTEYALELFENQPFHFLVKPLKTAQVIDVLRKILLASIEDNQSFQFMAGKQCHIVKCSDIIYAASSLRKIILHTTDGVYEFYGSMSELVRRLPEADFVLVHQSYLINWLHVRQIDCDKVKMSDSVEVPISRTYRKDVRSRYLQRLRWMR